MTEKVEQKEPTKDVTKNNFLSNKEALVVAGIVGFILFIFVFFSMLLGGRVVHRKFSTDLGGRYRGDFNTNMPMRDDDENISFGRSGMMKNRGGIIGKVTVVDGKKFKVEASGTTYEVQITDETRFPIESNTTVAVNDTVRVMGAKNSSGILQASIIAVMTNE